MNTHLVCSYCRKNYPPTHDKSCRLYLRNELRNFCSFYCYEIASHDGDDYPVPENSYWKTMNRAAEEWLRWFRIWFKQDPR